VSPGNRISKRESFEKEKKKKRLEVSSALNVRGMI